MVVPLCCCVAVSLTEVPSLNPAMGVNVFVRLGSQILKENRHTHKTNLKCVMLDGSLAVTPRRVKPISSPET